MLTLRRLNQRGLLERGPVMTPFRVSPLFSLGYPLGPRIRYPFEMERLMKAQISFAPALPFISIRWKQTPGRYNADLDIMDIP